MGRWRGNSIQKILLDLMGDWNLDRFVGNRLVNFVDPYGLATDPQPGSGNIRIVFNAFIPTSYVSAPGFNNPIFGTGDGDNRGFKSNGGSFRVAHTIILNPKTGKCTSWEEVSLSVVSGTLFGTIDDLVLPGQNQQSLQTHIDKDKRRGGWNIHIEGNAKHGFSIGPTSLGITYRFNYTLLLMEQLMGISVHTLHMKYGDICQQDNLHCCMVKCQEIWNCSEPFAVPWSSKKNNLPQIERRLFLVDLRCN